MALGDCPFWACVPSKLMLRPEEALHEAADVGGAAQRVHAADGLEVEAVFARRDKLTQGKDDTQVLVPMIEDFGATLVRGAAKITGIRRVQVLDHKGRSIDLEARLAVALCSGSEPVVPKIVRDTDPWTPRDATSALQAPEHLIIMGGGAVGCEMATAYSGYGTKVTLISSSAALLPSVDSETGALVRESLEQKGVTVITSTKVVGAARTSSGGVEVKLSDGKILNGSELLIAAGRKASLELGLESIGLGSGARQLDVDDSMKVATNDGQHWLYAPGDINGRSAFTHAAKYHGRIAGNAIAARALRKGASGEPSKQCVAVADATAMPQVIFTTPVVASIGLTRIQAQKQKKSVKAIAAPWWTVGAMVRQDSTPEGWAQWLIDEEERVLGVTLVGAGAGELIHAGTIAVTAKMRVADLLHAIPAFPTMSEVYLNLLEASGY
ncbi:Mercuric reductase [Pseudocercospora fuligena]|uniref:Mercuric reductase n=1 Tax=Pseudocercospora fuligena TaxID=685502 RepID=A0A8H6RF82_9PEZI|nr:Mercuric reductase [Pseudocercospora fuligena]